jgi:hypothetical protein
MEKLGGKPLSMTGQVEREGDMSLSAAKALRTGVERRHTGT